MAAAHDRSGDGAERLCRLCRDHRCAAAARGAACCRRPEASVGAARVAAIGRVPQPDCHHARDAHLICRHPLHPGWIAPNRSLARVLGADHALDLGHNRSARGCHRARPRQLGCDHDIVHHGTRCAEQVVEHRTHPCCCTLACCRRRPRRRRRWLLFYRRKSVTYKLSSDSELVIDANELVIGSAVGEGSFGTVYAGTWRATAVAVKRTRCVELSGRQLREFVDEASMLMRLRHPNVVIFMGITLEPPQLVTEFMDRGTLYDVLHAPDLFLDPSIMFKWAHNMTQGMQYLAHAGVIHSDFKSLNVLFDTSWVPKIADFGMSSVKAAAASVPTETAKDEKLAKASSRNAINPATSVASSAFSSLGTAAGHNGSRQNVGTLFWTAPEVLSSGPESTSSASDAYSLGLTLYELATRSNLFPGENPLAVALDVMDGRRPSLDKILPGLAPLVPLITQLWRQSPGDRPTFDALAVSLAELYSPQAVVYPSSAEAPSGNLVLCKVVCIHATQMLLASPSSAETAFTAFHTSMDKLARRIGMAKIDWALDSQTLAAQAPECITAFVSQIAVVVEAAGPVAVVFTRGEVAKAGGMLTGDGIVRIEKLISTLYYGEPYRVAPTTLSVFITADIVSEITSSVSTHGLSFVAPDEVLDDSVVQILRSGDEPSPLDTGLPSLPMSPDAATEMARLTVSDWLVPQTDIARYLAESTDSWMGSYAMSHPARLAPDGPNAIVKVFLRQKLPVADLILTAVLAASAAKAALMDSSGLLVGPIHACFSRPYISLIFPAYPRGSLADVLSTISPDNAMTVAISLAETLDVLHKVTKRGHGALRPSNVIIVTNETGDATKPAVRLIDYGLSAIKSNMGTMTMIPSVAYMSPEDIRGSAATITGDIFVLGSLLYEIVAREPPFQGTNALEVGYRISTGYRPDAAARISDATLADLITACWSDDPAQRPSLEHITHILRTSVVSFKAKPPTRR
ncbi:TKL protein kinase [Thecamonas trahens ATCC 50062]|uniref:TKL protein kinase n=1 Tax=Thecamonas trahens ATCC 50062 TaxID=461836 RepID=A0A0L0DNK8_THETB|nr:TKL protein kinase [Thecamonas trahens ATCC 50062]KNC53576.1 TKL protein kinase [Thecamonas trahens ATCC 50062]|eukprot:XP_013761893.1 TKL protein kinase [Thecamonas trahens ATCC 50062]